MNIKSKIASAIVTGALLVATFAPNAFAATTTTITGNGAHSINTAIVVNKCANVVVQGSSTTAITNIGTISNTGGNKANFNTNGTTTITTGGTTTTTGVVITGGSNTNSGGTNCCTCGAGPTDATISGNGAGSLNTAFVVNSSKNIVVQGNSTTAYTNIFTGSNTGGNHASGNTGGNVSITTGTSSTTTGVSVTGGSNNN